MYSAIVIFYALVLLRNAVQRLC